MLDLISLLFKIIDALIGDYVDIPIAILIIIIAILVATWPIIVMPILYVKCRNLKEQSRKIIVVSLLSFFLVTTIFYYISIPHDYVSKLGWRDSLNVGEFLGSQYDGPDKTHNLTAAHYNVIIVAKMDNWFLKERLLPSDDNLLDMVMFIIDFPATIIKTLLWFIWSFSLQYYWYLYPHAMGVFLTAIFLFVRTSYEDKIGTMKNRHR